MKYGIALMNAKMFCEERKEDVRIAKSKRKNDYCIIFDGQNPTENYDVVETVFCVEKGVQNERNR